MSRSVACLCFVLVLLLAGCQASPTPTPTSTAQRPTPSALPPTPTAPLPTVTPVPPSPTSEPMMVGEVTYMAGPREEGGSSLMKRIWNWQISEGNVPDCQECVDAVALLEPEYIGKKVWLRHPNGEVVGPLMVVDCAEEKNRDNLRKRGWVGDVSWDLAQKWKMSGPLEGVTVFFESPLEAPE